MGGPACGWELEQFVLWSSTLPCSCPALLTAASLAGSISAEHPKGPDVPVTDSSPFPYLQCLPISQERGHMGEGPHNLVSEPLFRLSSSPFSVSSGLSFFRLGRSPRTPLGELLHILQNPPPLPNILQFSSTRVSRYRMTSPQLLAPQPMAALANGSQVAFFPRDSLLRAA